MRAPTRLAALALLLLLSAGTARGIVVYRSEGGTNIVGFGSNLNFLKDTYTPPSTSTTGGDFSYGGALCPSPTTQNYLCGSIFGQATRDFMGLTMRASCNQRRHAAAAGMGGIIYGGAEITVIGMHGSAAAPASGFAKFHFGLGGTFSTTRSDAAVTVHATGYSFLSADKQRFIQCTGTNCGTLVSECAIGGGACEISVPYSDAPGTWSPGYYFVRLRTDVYMGATPSTLTGWDATAFANFADTLALTAITIEDVNHQAVPGAYFTIPDADGMGNDWVVPTEPPPPPTTTTLASTTTTTGAPGTTTTTAAHPTTTTTTAGNPLTTTTGASPTTTTVPAATEACGTCADEDVNGLVDFEEPACCPAAGVRTLAVRKARLTSQGADTLVALDATVPSTALGDVVPGRDLFLQLRVDGGPALFCAHIPAARFVLKRGNLAVFSDRAQSVAGAGGLTGVTLRASKRALLIHVEGRRAHFALPAPGSLRLVLAFDDPSGAHRCARTLQTFKRAGKKALRAP
jgi:hypothetical protein